MRALLAVAGACLAACSIASTARAQTQPADAPPATTTPAPPPNAPPPPPPGYGYPPQPYPYPYPYPYAYPPAARPKDDRPREIKFVEGQDPPPGYVYTERPRTGLIIAGSLVLGIPYVIGLYGAAAANFENGSAWLAVPGIGPFLMIAARDDECDESETEGSVGDSLECVGEIYLTAALILDGLAQTAGGVMLILGMSSNKQVWVRKDASFRVGPTRVGKTGYGLGLSGTF